MRAPRLTPVTGAVAGRPKIQLSLAVLLTVSVAALMLWRLNAGVDLTDESFYASLAVRFAGGDMMFRDDTNPAQLFSVFTTPLVWIYMRLAGTDGVILFLRACYLAIIGGLGVGIVAVFRDRLGTLFAVLCGLTYALLVPYSIPAPSYNTLGIVFALAGTLCVVRSLDARYPLRASAGAGFFFGLGVLAYPMLIVVFPAALISLALSHRRTMLRTALALVAGALPAALALLGIIASVGWSTFAPAMLYGGQVMKASLGTRLAWLGDGVVFFTDRPAVSALFIALAAGALVRPDRARRVLLWSAPALLVLASIKAPMHRSLEYAIVFSTLGVLAIVTTLRERRAAEISWLLVAIPPLLAAEFAYGVASSMGFWTAAAAACAAVPFAMGALLTAYRSTSRDERTWIPALIASTTILAIVSIAFATGAYRDVSPTEMNTLVARGPFRGMRTSAERAEFVEAMERDVTERVDGPIRLLAFDRLPAAYLFNDVLPAGNTTWLAANSGRFANEATIAYMQAHSIRPDMVMMSTAGGALGYEESPTYGPDHILATWTRENNYREVVTTDGYSLWVPGSD